MKKYELVKLIEQSASAFLTKMIHSSSDKNSFKVMFCERIISFHEEA